MHPPRTARPLAIQAPTWCPGPAPASLCRGGSCRGDLARERRSKLSSAGGATPTRAVTPSSAPRPAGSGAPGPAPAAAAAGRLTLFAVWLSGQTLMLSSRQNAKSSLEPLSRASALLTRTWAGAQREALARTPTLFSSHPWPRPFLVPAPDSAPLPTSPSRLHPTAFCHAPYRPRPSQVRPAHLAGSPASRKLARVVVGHVLPGGAGDRVVVLEYGHRLICKQIVSRVGSPQDSWPDPKEMRKVMCGRAGFFEALGRYSRGQRRSGVQLQPSLD